MRENIAEHFIDISFSYNKVVGNRHLTTSQDLLPFIAKAVQWCGMDLTCYS